MNVCLMLRFSSPPVNVKTLVSNLTLYSSLQFLNKIDKVLNQVNTLFFTFIPNFHPVCFQYIYSYVLYIMIQDVCSNRFYLSKRQSSNLKLSEKKVKITISD